MYLGSSTREDSWAQTLPLPPFTNRIVMDKRFYIKGFKIFISNNHKLRLGYHRTPIEKLYIWFYLGRWQLGIWDRRN